MAKDIYDEWREWQAKRDEDAIRAGKYQSAAADKLRDDLLYEAVTPGNSNLTGKVSSGIGKATAYKGDAVWNGVRDIINGPTTTPDPPDYYGGGGGTQTTSTTAEWDPQLPSFSYEDAPEFVSRYQGLIDEYLNGVLNRPAFSYNYEDDPLYQQYAKSYGDAGRRAMQDTLAQISARTGGLASSYAGSASQQAYNQYMARLADKVPELQQLAYQMYQDEDARARSNLSLLQGMDATDYGRYTDRLGQWNTDRSFAYGVYGDERDNALQMAQLAASMGDYRGLKALGIDTSVAEAKARGSGSSTSKSNALNRYLTYLGMGGDPSSFDPALLEATGLTPEELSAYASYYADQAAGGYSGIDTDEALKILASGDETAINSPKLRGWYEDYLGVDPGDATAEPEITNATSGNMVFIPGLHFVDYDTLYQLVEAGYVDAEYSNNGKNITFKKA